jgi:hypothetical protein
MKQRGIERLKPVHLEKLYPAREGNEIGKEPNHRAVSPLDSSFMEVDADGRERLERVLWQAGVAPSMHQIDGVRQFAQELTEVRRDALDDWVNGVNLSAGRGRDKDGEWKTSS